MTLTLYGMTLTLYGMTSTLYGKPSDSSVYVQFGITRMVLLGNGDLRPWVCKTNRKIKNNLRL